ncbi:gluconate:H+ symporter, GntP family [Pseudomonas costantinii]|uniref:Gluconate:H+ symporter, GntP family n=1 Tax=Pseudomonas costantinii TaxID=168469 RepID=A0A1H5B359_9PSED|nr:gluconate:H+ symporter, GntP family [Pseudomonas costantinii]
MTNDTYLLLDALITTIGLLLLITRFMVHPFVALGFIMLLSSMVFSIRRGIPCKTF